MRGEGIGRQAPTGIPDGELWRRSRTIDAPEDDAARYLDFAGFADGVLDPDDRERIAEWLARDQDPMVQEALADIAAARAFGAAQFEAVSETILARADPLIGDGEPQSATIVAFRPKNRARTGFSAMARSGAEWGSLAAAMAMASWLGFALGMDISGSVSQGGRAGEDGFLNELLDPSAGLLRDPSDGA